METHWQWRMKMARQIAAALDPEKFGVAAFYVFGSAKNATAAEASDIDILIHFRGSEFQERELRLWLADWSRQLAELNFQRTGHATDGLLDVHLVTDADIEKRTSYAVKIGATSDAALPLPLGTSRKEPPPAAR
jgi:predicted nucleotidyltransferase